MKTRLIGAFLVATILCMAGGTHAMAAPAADTEAEYQVQLWTAVEGGKAIAIISVTLPETATLPAVVRVPVPTGTTVDWAGEVVGASADSDIPREFQVKDGVGGKYAEFTLAESRDAQIEVSGVVTQTTADSTEVTLDYVQSVPSSVTAFSVRLPAGVKNVKVTPAAVGNPDANEVGETLYTLPSQELATGGKAAISATYGFGAAEPASTGLTTAQVIGGAMVLLVVALVVLLFVSRGKGASA